MPVPTKASNPALGFGVKNSDESETPSNNLWVGNLSPDVSDSELMVLFARHGALDSVSTYSSRSYAFVYFKRIEDAMVAKQALQGTAFRGNLLKIEFARPAKPCRSLWVGGFSPGLSKEELEEQFLKFGKIEDFRFLRDRNTAFVDYFKLEDAAEAMKNMNGKHIGGNQIRVDFLRSQPARKEQWSDAADGQFQGRNTAALDFYASQKRPQPYSQLQMSREGDSQPSNVLWIGYPPSVQIDEHMLHNAMILFGEIEGIRSFPSRHCSFVEFRSVDEARRAKEGLQGRLFNDRRITILFATSDLAPGKDYSTFYPGNKGARPEKLLNEPQFLPVQIDGFGLNHPTASNNFAGQLPPGGILGPNASTRALGPQGGIDPLISGTELNNDLIAGQKGQDGKMGPNWRKLSPLPGIFPSAVPGIVGPSRSATSGLWGDLLDINQLHREPKRLRIDGAFPIEDHGQLMEYGGVSPVGARITSRAPSPSPPDNDFIWRGIIAKGGTPVCRARCIPIRKGIGNDLPNVVNCSARTGLDMLAKHYADAIGFDIVFFLPDSEDDFASYTEFLRYLGANNRAGVAKFDDGTTLFLVPPSDFLTKVLKVPGPERLYGVVLKFPPTSYPSVQQSPQVPYTDTQQFAPHQGNSPLLPTKVEQILPVYDRNNDSKLPLKSFYTPGTVSQSGPQGFSSISTVSTSQAGVTLTPDLIATLTSFLPATAKYSGLEGGKAVSSSSAVRPLVASGDGSLPQLWNNGEPTLHYTGHSSEQLGNVYKTQASHYQPHPSVSSTSGQPSQVLHGSSQISDSAISLQQQVAVSSLALTNYVDPSRSRQVSNPTQVGQQQLTATMQKDYGVMQGIDPSGYYNAQVPSQPNVAVGSSNLTHGTNFSQESSVAAFVADNPMQHLQCAVTGAGQGTQDAEADKNQRYQSTLQFAADLLLKIQQQHKTQGGQVPGN